MPAPSGGAGTPEPGGRRRRWGRRRVVVRDESMRPALEPGDRLRVDARAYRERPPRVGEIVVFADPVDPERWLVKRVSAVDVTAGTVEVRGDAGGRVRDSRQFGPVPFAALVGRVYRRYYPVDRRRDFRDE